MATYVLCHCNADCKITYNGTENIKYNIIILFLVYGHNIAI
jgi:hypothetical protein